MDNKNQDLTQQYQDILDRYSKELDGSSTVPPAPEKTTEVIPEPLSLPPVNPPTPKYTVSTPTAPSQPSNLFKYFFYLSLIIFIGVFGTIVYTILSTSRAQSLTADITPTPEIIVPTSAPVASVCEVNDKKYSAGESFSAADNCNTCTCGADLTITCTQKSCEATPTAKVTTAPTVAVDPLSVAKKYLDAYVKGDWSTAKSVSGDSKFDETTAAGYELVSYKIISSKYDNTDKNYFHVYINFTNKSGKVLKVVPPSTPLEVLMTKSTDGWKALTWYFFQ